MGRCKKRIIDLHRFEYANDGSILYGEDSFLSKIFSRRGKIDGIDVSCIESYNQVIFHLRHEFDENDMHDIKQLCENFHIEIPEEYR